MSSDNRPKYGIFIIESMDIDNEANGKLDGLALKTIPANTAIKTKKAFPILGKLE